MNRELEDLGNRIADYMATRDQGWSDEAVMRAAAVEAVRLVLTEASYEALPLLLALREP